MAKCSNCSSETCDCEATAPAHFTATLRDQFAMAALTGLTTHKEFPFERIPKVAEAAFFIADAMLEARK